MSGAPDLPATAPGLLERAAGHFGADPAVVAPDGSALTYEALASQAGSFGATLARAGVGPGDRVAIWAPNSVRWIVALFGLWDIGAVLVPVNTRFKGDEAADILRRGRARVVVTVNGFLGTDYPAMLAAARDRLPDLELVVLAEGPPSSGAVAWEDLDRAVGPAPAGDVGGQRPDVGADDVADILFTSGTTGRPKGVVQTHGRTCRVASDWVAMTGLARHDRYLMVNPYFHMFGLKAGILAATVAGATMLPEPVFDVERALARVQDERITVLPGAPTLYQSLLDAPDRDRVDLSSLRVAVTGAADIPVELVHRIREELPFGLVVTGYGLTEAGTVAATSPDDDAETVATTVGRPRPGFELRIVDGSLVDLPAGQVGEILVRGASVMREYLDDPAATAEVLDGDGWLRTGDLGLVDERGDLRIVGRSKDMLIVGGFNVYPAEVESLLLAHPDVAQVAVVGMPDDRLGEVAAAFVVARAGSSVDEEGLVAWAREHMANYKAPRRVVAVDALPINATGKVVKDELRARIVRA